MISLEILTDVDATDGQRQAEVPQHTRTCLASL